MIFQTRNTTLFRFSSDFQLKMYNYVKCITIAVTLEAKSTSVLILKVLIIICKKQSCKV